MKKRLCRAAGLAVLAFAAIMVGGVLIGSHTLECMDDHPDNLVGCVFSPPAQLTVDVTGNVDEVVLYAATEGAQPVGRIVTNGRNKTRKLALATSPQYYFVVRKGSQTYSSPLIGWSTKQQPAHLQIRGLNEWQGW